MENSENIDIGVALLTIMEFCIINNECVNCPMHYFCYTYFKVAPCELAVGSVPKLNVNIEY